MRTKALLLFLVTIGLCFPHLCVCRSLLWAGEGSEDDALGTILLCSEDRARNSRVGSERGPTGFAEIHAFDNVIVDEVIKGFEKNSRKEVGFDDITGAFDESLEEAEVTQPEEPSSSNISGLVKLFSSYNYAQSAPKRGEADYRGLSHIRPEVYLKLEQDLPRDWKARIAGRADHDLAYGINGHGEYTEDMLDSMESEAEFHEAHLEGSLSRNLDLKMGRQIVVWGTSDNLRVTDVLNPLDNREPGIADIWDLRLPVTMTKLDYYCRKWNLTGVVVHEIRFDKEPAFGSDYFPGSTPLPDEDKPGTGFENQELGLALNGIFRGWDLSFYGAHFFDDQPHLESTTSGFVRRHSRLTMLGASVEVLLGNWLLKGEVAGVHGLKFFALPKQKFSRLDALLGLEYSGISEANICVEAVNRHLLDFDQQLEEYPDYARDDDFQWALRFTRHFLHDRLALTFLAIVFGVTGDEGRFERMQFDYEWLDGITVTVGAILYHAGDRIPFQKIRDNDRLFLQLKYSF